MIRINQYPQPDLDKRIYRVYPNTPEHSVLMERPVNYDILAFLYKHKFYPEIFYKFLDIDLALGIVGIGYSIIAETNLNLQSFATNIDYFEISF